MHRRPNAAGLSPRAARRSPLVSGAASVGNRQCLWGGPSSTSEKQCLEASACTATSTIILGPQAEDQIGRHDHRNTRAVDAFEAIDTLELIKMTCRSRRHGTHFNFFRTLACVFFRATVSDFVDRVQNDCYSVDERPIGCTDRQVAKRRLGDGCTRAAEAAPRVFS